MSDDIYNPFLDDDEDEGYSSSPSLLSGLPLPSETTAAPPAASAPYNFLDSKSDHDIPARSGSSAADLTAEFEKETPVSSKRFTDEELWSEEDDDDDEYASDEEFEELMAIAAQISANAESELHAPLTTAEDAPPSEMFEVPPSLIPSPDPTDFGIVDSDDDWGFSDADEDVIYEDPVIALTPTPEPTSLSEFSEDDGREFSDDEVEDEVYIPDDIPDPATMNPFSSAASSFAEEAPQSQLEPELALESDDSAKSAGGLKGKLAKIRGDIKKELRGEDPEDEEEAPKPPKPKKKGKKPSASKSLGPSANKILNLLANLLAIAAWPGRFVFTALARFPLIGPIFKIINASRWVNFIAVGALLFALFGTGFFTGRSNYGPLTTTYNFPDGGKVSTRVVELRGGNVLGEFENKGEVIARVTPVVSVYSISPASNPMSWVRPKKIRTCKKLPALDIGIGATVYAKLKCPAVGFGKRASIVLKAS